MATCARFLSVLIPDLSSMLIQTTVQVEESQEQHKIFALFSHHTPTRTHTHPPPLPPNMYISSQPLYIIIILTPSNESHPSKKKLQQKKTHTCTAPCKGCWFSYKNLFPFIHSTKEKRAHKMVSKFVTWWIGGVYVSIWVRVLERCAGVSPFFPFCCYDYYYCCSTPQKKVINIHSNLRNELNFTYDGESCSHLALLWKNRPLCGHSLVI